MRNIVSCDLIAFCILFWLCFGVFVVVGVEINAKILIYCAKFCYSDLFECRLF